MNSGTGNWNRCSNTTLKTQHFYKDSQHYAWNTFVQKHIGPEMLHATDDLKCQMHLWRVSDMSVIGHLADHNKNRDMH